MKASASSFRCKSRTAARRIAVFFSVLLVAFMIAVRGWRLYTQGPKPRDVAEARNRLYESWCRENKDAYEAFKELAGANGWQMYVWTTEGVHFRWGWGSIGRLDCGQSAYRALHEPSRDRFTNKTTAFREGKAAFIECAREFSFWGHIKERDYELGVLQSDGTLTKVNLPDTEHVLDLAMGDAYVFLSVCPDRLWLYDIDRNSLSEVRRPTGPPWKGGVLEVAVVGDKFLLIGPDSPGAALSVLEAGPPQTEVARMEKVRKMIVAGDRIIVERDGVCLLFDPECGGAERLTVGHLLAELGEDEFLFCSADESPISSLTEVLYRYDIVTRSSSVLWEPPKDDPGFRLERGREKVYETTKAVLSPDRRFLLVPWQIPTSYHRRTETIATFEYDVYDLANGQKRGSFLTIHEGKFYFEFLGWDTSDQAPGP